MVTDKKFWGGRTWVSQQGYYNTKSWRILRLKVLTKEPLCRLCRSLGYRTPAVMVDHIIPITPKNIDMFLDEVNLQPLCDGCHQFKTNRRR